MKVEVFSLCDAATDQFGKLNVLGCFDLICSPGEPVVHQACTIALRIRFSQVEQGFHSLRITLSDDDGQNIIPAMNGNFEIRMAPEAVSFAQNLIFNMQALEFPRYGDYSFNLYLDNKLIDSLPIYLRPAKRNSLPT